ncbi:MAG: hypothetical protein E6868_08345 [Pantoea sp.]|uniref:hypothetical protein n=1 Tax=Pantoea sp. TaxID=69393 RepID=UPI002903740F|nr:hypothetical protein [Pantoea sp.]MDU1573246.1 hypothetical protein [Pantoea sp.]
MNNVIPLKRPEHVISDTELDKLASDISRFVNRYPNSMCLPAGIRKLLSDALKRDKPQTFANEVLERNWQSHLSDLKQEQNDGENEFPPAG